MIAPAWPAGVGLDVYDEIDSTQTEAKRRVAAGERGPVWIAAKRQTAGLGRRGPGWESPTGNLSATILLKPPIEIAKAPQVSFVAALAVHDLVDTFAPGRATLKWPNDPLLDGAKVAGILPDSAGRADGTLDWMMVGIGVNLATSPTGTPYPTASIKAATGTAPDFDHALSVLANAWERRFTAWLTGDFAAICAAWLERAHGLGKPIVVKLPNETFEAVFEGLDPSGALIARLPGGSVRLVAAGEVFPVH